MRLYIIRHADPNYETDSITEDGHLEAAALAKRLAVHGFDRIYTSPMGRAKATMEYTAKLLGMEHAIEPWTRELWPELALQDTPWGNLMAFDLPGEVFRGGLTRPTHENWHTIEAIKNEPFREVFETVQRNSDEFMARQGYVREGARYRFESPNKVKIAVFCHNGFGLTWLAHLLDIPLPLVWSGFWLPPTSVTTILMDERSPGWAVPRCIGLGDVSHLYEAGMEVKPRGIITNYD
jgi:probable phosphoglycerate mutase